ncbi:YajQ family cyclic di-GMP-binding protein [Exiguobacterium sp. Helios]|uniref:YajQ family cyclic di-GMP-binding protein n=1 Tax=Exiguobacterium TaxID=33986 RepID=UPI00047B1125|nr:MULTISPECIES: YajQ family cyclic di-GMP-binding protein [Exiguobacterium]MCK2158534.1 YajQ family cyclic di-GMP-binding protein [Exiguobacterium sp. 17-1]QNR19490.1 YajQ family cyclic di-GMP-binding protein [Exiguobacterium sp. Helios]RDB32877.1 YajQ family cyclic di-GMP-binding protein [Exiguobacterium sp. RIT594]
MAAKDNSFDIVSQINIEEVKNAMQVALKEITNRFDFKGSKSDMKLEKEDLILISDDNFKLDQVKDVLTAKLIKREVPTKNLQYEKVEQAAGNTVRQRVILKSGIDRDDAKKINNAVKESKLKVKTQIQDDQIRVTGKSRDDLQQVMQIVRELPLSVDVQFLNFR